MACTVFVLLMNSVHPKEAEIKAAQVWVRLPYKVTATTLHAAGHLSECVYVCVHMCVCVCGGGILSFPTAGTYMNIKDVFFLSNVCY